MTALLQALTTFLQALSGALIGPLGILFITVGIAGTCIGCIFFHLPLHWLWKVLVLSVVLIAAGAIAAGLTA